MFNPTLLNIGKLDCTLGEWKFVLYSSWRGQQKKTLTASSWNLQQVYLLFTSVHRKAVSWYNKKNIGVGNGNPLEYFCLEYLVDRGAWQATAHKVGKGWTRRKQLSTHYKRNIEDRVCYFAHLSLIADWDNYHVWCCICTG